MIRRVATAGLLTAMLACGSAPGRDTADPISKKTVVDSAGRRWRRVDNSSGVFGKHAWRQMFMDVMARGDCAVGVGWNGPPAGIEKPAAWNASDCATWARATVIGPAEGGDGIPRRPIHTQMLGIAPTPTGLVAVGRYGYDNIGDSYELGNTDAAVWTSTDAVTWQPVKLAEASFGGPGLQAMTDVVRTSAGSLVAVGYDGPFLHTHAAVWASVDGAHWDRSPDSSPLANDGALRMNAVAQVPGGGLVAVGYSLPTPEATDIDGVVWVSADGRSWQRIDELGLGGSGDQDVTSVVALADGSLIAVGRTAGETALWRSPDARRWARVETDAFSSAGLSRVIQTRRGELVAVGAAGSSADQADAAVWTSEDGVAWARVPGGPFGGPYDQAINAICETADGTLVAAGYDFYDAALWVADPGA